MYMPMYMYTCTCMHRLKSQLARKFKFEKQDCGLTWLYWNALKSTAGARRVNDRLSWPDRFLLNIGSVSFPWELRITLYFLKLCSSVINPLVMKATRSEEKEN